MSWGAPRLLADLRLFVSSKVSVSITRPHIYVVKRILFFTLFSTLALRNPLICLFFHLYMSMSINYYYNYSPVQWIVSMSLRLFWSSHLWIVSSKLLPALTMQSCASLCLPDKIQDYQWFNCDLVFKGSRQKLLSGFFPLRGGYPPFPLMVFGQDDFPLRGEGGTPQFP